MYMSRDKINSSMQDNFTNETNKRQNESIVNEIQTFTILFLQKLIQNYIFLNF